MVAIPISLDQPGVAARIAWTGTGEMVPLPRLSVPKLRETITQVLTHESYRTNAVQLQQAIHDAGGVTRAVDIIEKVLLKQSSGNVCMTWKTILSFIASATLLTLLSGWLIGANVLPIQTKLIHSEAEESFVQIWFQVALMIGLLLPGVAFLMWIRRPKTRTVFGFYLLVLGIQIVTEQICIRVFSSSLLVIVGTLYTGFRVWQLWQGQQVLRAIAQSRNRERVARGLLWLLLLFWSANLIVLLVTGWLRIL